MTTLQANIFPEIKIAIDAHIKGAVEKAIEQARAQVEAELRKRLASIALEIYSHYDVMRRGDDLVITVHMNKGVRQ